MTLTERFEALPEDVQEHLVRIGRLAAGMNADEKEYARTFFGLAVQSCAKDLTLSDRWLPGSEMMLACGSIVTYFDEASGDAASRLVVR